MINRIIFLYRRYFWSPEKYARQIGVKVGKLCDNQIRDFGSEPYLVEIGNHVQITKGTKIFTHGGAWVFRDKYPKMDFFGKIKIHEPVVHYDLE